MRAPEQPSWGERARDAALHWFGRKARHEAARELEAVKDAPRFRVSLPFGRSKHPYGHGEQTFRAFVQINLLPKAR